MDCLEVKERFPIVFVGEKNETSEKMLNILKREFPHLTIEPEKCS